MIKMKKIAALALVLLALPSLGAASDCLSSSDSSGAPSIPHDFRGDLTINGEPAPQGTEVSAYIDGEKVSVQTSVSQGTYADQDDRFVVCGGGSGDTITFRTGNEEVGESTYYSGNSTEKDLTGSDSENPTASFSVPGTVTTGESVELDASGSSDDTQILNYDWSVSGAQGETPSVSFSSTGEKTVELTVTDLVGNTDTTTQNIQVSSGSTGGGSGGGGSFAGGGVPTTGGSTSDQELTVDVTDSGNTVTADVNYADNSSEVEIDLQESGATGVERLTVSKNQGASNFSVEVTNLGRAAPTEVSAVDSALTYYRIQINGADTSEISSIATTFKQSKTRLEQNSIYPSQMMIQSFNAGGWQELSTVLVGETDTSYRFETIIDPPGYFAATSSGTRDQEEECTENCEQSPRETAEETIEQANQTVEEETEANELLERAQDAYEEGDYSRAEILAEEAQRMSSDTTESSSGLPVKEVAAVLAVLAFTAVIVMKKDSIAAMFGDSRESEIADKMDEVARLLRAHHYDDSVRSDARRKIGQAELAVENENYDRAEQIIENLRRELENEKGNFGINR